MKKEIWIYIEGSSALRNAFKEFLKPLYDEAKKKGVRFNPPLMCGSGYNAYEDFKTGFRADQQAIHILLVDAEEPLAGNTGPWTHKKWNSLGLDDSHCHLMVQTMEAWFIADIDAIDGFYKRGFKPNLLPQNSRIEEIPKKDLFDGLHRATKDTKKGPYHKTNHAPEILKSLNVAKVRQAAPHCDRLFQTLTEKMNEP